MRRLALIASLALIAAACGSTDETVAPTATTTAPASTTVTSNATTPAHDPDTTASQPITSVPEQGPSSTKTPGGCRPETFLYPPVDLDAVEYLSPFGLMVDSHVTPVDHQYFQNFKDPERHIDVFSPADGRIVSIQHFGVPVTEDRIGIVDDYLLEIRHTCTVSSMFIHITSLEPRIASEAPETGKYAQTDIAVSAGEKIGWFTKNVDYNIVDLEYSTDGIVDPASYEREPWKTHVPDTFGYFTPEIAAKMESLSLRSIEPRGGVFTLDIDGRLVGNWFEEGTGGYGGLDPMRYWGGHLAFAYNHIDPSMLMVSIGTWIDRSEQFAVLGNAPDPATVDVDSGPIIYELVDWDYMVGDQRWDRVTFAEGIRAVPSDYVVGSVIVELLDDRTIMFETFPGLSRSAIDGFTSEARRFTR